MLDSGWKHKTKVKPIKMIYAGFCKSGYLGKPPNSEIENLKKWAGAEIYPLNDPFKIIPVNSEQQLVGYILTSPLAWCCLLAQVFIGNPRQCHRYLDCS